MKKISLIYNLGLIYSVVPSTPNKQNMCIEQNTGPLELC